MNKTTKTLKQFEKQSARKLDKKFKGLKHWVFYGDMHKGILTIVIAAQEKK